MKKLLIACVVAVAGLGFVGGEKKAEAGVRVSVGFGGGYRYGVTPYYGVRTIRYGYRPVIAPVVPVVRPVVAPIYAPVVRPVITPGYGFYRSTTYIYP